MGSGFSRQFLLRVVARHPFSAAHFPGHCFGLIPASCSFTASAFPVLPLTPWVPPIKQPLASVCPKKMGQEKGEDSAMSYLYVKWNRSGLQFARPAPALVS